MVDSKSPASGSQRRGLGLEQVGLRFMYFLVAVPLLTDLIENGRWPRSPRGWVTEVVAGAVIAVLVRKVRREQATVLALARHDALTGLLNRRSFEEAVVDDSVRVRRSGQPLSLVYIDLDNFKQINDRAGHAAGDLVLRQLAAAIRHAIRERVDRGFRVGGDEFAVLLPGSPAGQAEAVVTRIREHCARSDPLWVGGPLGISSGIVELESGEASSAFVRCADAAMYRNKRLRTP